MPVAKNPLDYLKNPEPEVKYGVQNTGTVPPASAGQVPVKTGTTVKVKGVTTPVPANSIFAPVGKKALTLDEQNKQKQLESFNREAQAQQAGTLAAQEYVDKRAVLTADKEADLALRNQEMQKSRALGPWTGSSLAEDNLNNRVAGKQNSFNENIAYQEAYNKHKLDNPLEGDVKEEKFELFKKPEDPQIKKQKDLTTATANGVYLEYLKTENPGLYQDHISKQVHYSERSKNVNLSEEAKKLDKEILDKENINFDLKALNFSAEALKLNIKDNTSFLDKNGYKEYKAISEETNVLAEEQKKMEEQYKLIPKGSQEEKLFINSYNELVNKINGNVSAVQAIEGNPGFTQALEDISKQGSDFDKVAARAKTIVEEKYPEIYKIQEADEVQKQRLDDIDAGRIDAPWTEDLSNNLINPIAKAVADIPSSFAYLPVAISNMFSDEYGAADRIYDKINNENEKYKALNPDAGHYEYANGKKTFVTNMLPEVVGVGANMGVMIVESLIGVKALSSLSGLAATTTMRSVATVATGYIQAAHGFYDAGIEAGMTRDEANAYAQVQAIPSALLELINPEAAFLSKSSTVAKRSAAEYMRILKKGGPDALSLAREGAQKIVMNIAGENIQELSQLTSELGVNHLTNKVLGTNLEVTKDLENKIKHTVGVTTIVSGIVGIGGAALGVSASKNQLLNDAIYDAATNPNDYKKLIIEQTQEGKLFEKDAANVAYIVNTAETAMSRIGNIDEASKRGTLPYMMEKINLEGQKKNLDKIYHPEIDKKIAELDKAMLVISKTKSDEVAQLRADEQEELKSSIPNIEDYKVDGNVDRNKITDEKVLKKFDQIYDKYDKLISPLLPAKPNQEVKGKVAGVGVGGDVKIQIDKPAITKNTAADVNTVKALSNEDGGGATFNLDGSKYEATDGLMVPIDSMNTTTEELTPEMVADFVAERQEMIGDAGIVKHGIYKFPNSNRVSIDLSVVAPESSRDKALAFGKEAGQKALFDLKTKEDVDTGATGDNTMKFTPEQSREIAKALNEGRDPDVFGKNTTDTKVNVEPTEADVVKTPILKRINKAFLKIGTTIFDNAEQLISKAKEILGEGKQPRFSITMPDGSKKTVQPVNADVVNGFYSPLEKIINESKSDKLPAKQWAEKFAKGEEARVTGLADWLSQQQGSVSKADIQQYLKDNRISVVEVVKGGEVSESEIDTLLNDEFGQDMTRDEARDYLSNDENNNQTKFSQYQLEGQKENYKEVLVTMPSKGLPEGYEVKKIVLSNGDAVYRANGDGLSTPHKTYQEAENELKERAKEFYGTGKLGGAKFKSSHFEEPNILVHLRMNTRTDAQGNKVLFLEEVQSDWGQQGKKGGFDDINRDKLVEKQGQLENSIWNYVKEKYSDIAENLTLKEFINVKNSDAWFFIENYTKSDTVLNNLWNDLKSTKNQISNVKKTAQAPFVTDTNAWTKLGLKVALKEAVKQGADKIAWTTGEQQNDRYDLSKQVDSITYSKYPDGTYQFSGDKNDNQLFNYQRIPENKLEDYVGKEVAKKIIDSEGEPMTYGNKEEGAYGELGKTLSGVDLKVGGKGMKGFYGSPTEGSLGIVGNVAKSLFKQEPKTVEIDANERSKATKDFDDLKQSLQFEKQLTDKGKTGIVSTFNKDGSYTIEWNENKPSTQHSIDITPELKAQVEQGQPLFHYNDKGEILGFTHEGKIYLNGEKITAGTTMEEAGHIWTNWAKEKRPDLYKAGLDKVNGSSYLKEVEANKNYQEDALKLGKKGSKEYNQYMKEEALAKAIADNGAKFVTESKRSDFKEWARAMWRAVIKEFGIKDATPEQISKMPLEEFAKKAAADIFTKESNVGDQDKANIVAKEGETLTKKTTDELPATTEEEVGNVVGEEEETKQQIEKFGVNKEDVGPVYSVISKVFQGLKEAGLTVAKNVGEWVGIGKGVKEKGALKIGYGAFEKVGFEETAEYKKLKESGNIKEGFDIKSIEGKPVVVINPDNMITGQIFSKEGNPILDANGGIHFVSKFGDVWASSDKSTANTLAKYINTARELDIKNGGDGTVHIVVTKGSLGKSLTSQTGAKGAMRVIEYLVDTGMIPLRDFRNALISAGKAQGVDFNGKLDSKSIHEDISKKFFGVNDSSFKGRGFFIMDVINHIAENSKSVHDNIAEIRDALNSKEIGRKITFGGAGIKDAIGNLFADQMTQGVPNSYAYATIEISKPVEVVKGSHESYPFHIKQIGKERPKLNILSEAKHIKNIVNPKEGSTNLGSNQVGMAEGTVKSAKDIESLKQGENAQYRIESGKNTVEALKDFDGSPEAVVAITHEIIHPTVVAIIDGAKEGNEVGAKHTQTIVVEFNKENPNNKVTTEELINGNDNFKEGKTSKKYRAVQEFIAKNWEKYHTEGAKGFSKRFQEVLEQITKAFKAVYKSISGKELTPELRKMFDEILGKEESIVTKQLNINKDEKKSKGTRLFSKPLEATKSIAERYAKNNGIKRETFETITSSNFDKENAIEIAKEYDKMKDDPTDPEVRKSYEKMVEETLLQANEILKDGYTIEVNNTEPYSNSEDMISDLRDSKNMRIFSTESGFGDEPITDKQRSENPLLRDSGLKDKNGVALLNNDVFRFVHDFFGHSELGNSFGAIGEENAWLNHATMYSPLARRAMTSETRGQNSWVNFSGANEKVFEVRDKARRLRAEGKIQRADALIKKVYRDMKFADQKIGLLPEKYSSIDQAEAPLSELRGEVGNIIYPDVVFAKSKTETQAKLAVKFYDNIINKFNEVFGRDLKLETSTSSDGNFNVTVEYETGLRPKYFAYPTGKIGEHEIVDNIDKNVPMTSLRHELIHEMLVKNITDKFERINNMDNSANIESIEEVQRNRAYNYSPEDVFYERVVEAVERAPDNVDTFDISAYGDDITNRLKKEIKGKPTKENVLAALKELLDGSNKWLKNNLNDIFKNLNYSKINDITDVSGVVGKIIKDKFENSRTIFPSELYSKMKEFTAYFNKQYKETSEAVNESQASKGERKKIEPDTREERVKKINDRFDQAEQNTIEALRSLKLGLVTPEGSNVTKQGMDLEDLIKVAFTVARQAVIIGGDIKVAIEKALKTLRGTKAYQDMVTIGSAQDISIGDRITDEVNNISTELSDLKTHAGAERILADKFVNQEIKDGVIEKGTEYRPITVEMQKGDAKNFVEFFESQNKLEELEELIYDDNSGLTPTTRVNIATELLSRYSSKAMAIREYMELLDKNSPEYSSLSKESNDLFRKAGAMFSLANTRIGSEAGRALQAQKELYKMLAADKVDEVVNIIRMDAEATIDKIVEANKKKIAKSVKQINDLWDQGLRGDSLKRAIKGVIEKNLLKSDIEGVDGLVDQLYDKLSGKGSISATELSNRYRTVLQKAIISDEAIEGIAEHMEVVKLREEQKKRVDEMIGYYRSDLEQASRTGVPLTKEEVAYHNRTIFKEWKALEKLDLKAQEAIEKASKPFKDPRDIYKTLTGILKMRLLSPLSLFKNISGYLPYVFIHPVLKVPSSVMDWAYTNTTNLFRGDKVSRSQNFLLDIVGYNKYGFPFAFREAVRRFWTGKTNPNIATLDTTSGLNSVDAWKDIFRHRRAGERGYVENKISAIMEAISPDADIISRLLAAPDVLVRKTAEKGAIFSMAKNQNLSGPDLWDAIINPPKEVKEVAEEIGARAAYQNKNQVAKLLDDIGSKTESIYIGRHLKGLAKFLLKEPNIPFVTTPINIVSAGLKLTMWPVSLSAAVWNIKKSYTEQEKGNKVKSAYYRGRAIESFSMMGFALAAGSFALEMLLGGALTGAADKEDKDIKSESFQHKHPNSLNYSAVLRKFAGNKDWSTPALNSKGENTDTWIHLAGLGPIGVALATHANVYQSMDVSERNNTSLSWNTLSGIEAIPSAMRAALDQTYLAGAHNLMDAIFSQDPKGTFMTNYLKTISTTFLPNTLAAMSRSSSEYMMDTKGGSVGDRFKAGLKERLFMGDELPTKVTVWGSPVSSLPPGTNKYAYYFLDPFQSYNVNTQSFKYLLFDFYNNTGIKTIIPTAPENKIVINKEPVELSPKEYEEYQTIVGKMREAETEKYVLAGDFNTDDQDTRVATLNRIYDGTKEQAKRTFIMNNERLLLLSGGMESSDPREMLRNMRSGGEMDKIREDINKMKSGGSSDALREMIDNIKR